MSLSTLSIKRPVLTLVLMTVVVLFGYIGFRELGVREYPSVDPPVITVSASYPGANADVIESQITEPLEGSINGVAGIRSLSSVSREGRSTITVEFTLETDLEAAANDVRDRVSRAQRSLPPDIDPPTVQKADANSDPIIFANMRSDSRSPLELSRLANDLLKERLQTISGVSEAVVWGERRYSMRLYLDPARLAAHRLTPSDVQAALNRENVELPTGRIDGATTELSVRTQGLLRTEADFNQMVIAQQQDRVVRLADMGFARLEPENQRSILRRDGVPMVICVVIPQPGANNIEIADEFYRRLELIKKDLPADVQVDVPFDATQYIRQAIAEVEETLVIAFSLVALIIFLFLRDWRSTLLPVLAIPISLIGVGFIMYLLGFTINVLTLLAIVLSIGIVVDDAIVVMENIYAKIEAGMSPRQAALLGSNEIYGAIIATTLVLAAVFLPLLFLEGLVGRLFLEFGVVVAGAVIISAFVSLTLTPMLAARMLKHQDKPNWFYRITEPFFQRFTHGYRTSLAAFLQVRWLSGLVLVGALVMAVVLWGNLPDELAPMEDRNSFRIISTAPEGTSFYHMDAFVQEAVKLTQDTMGTDAKAIISVTSPGFGGTGGANTSFVNVILKDRKERRLSQQQWANEMTQAIKQLTTANSFVAQPQSIGSSGRGGGQPVQYVLQAPTFEELQKYLPGFMEAASKSPAFSYVDANLKFNKPELRLEIDRAKARTLGVSVAEIARTLQLALAEQRYGFFILDGQQYSIIGQLLRENRDEPLDLKSIYVRGSGNQLVQLDNLVKFSEEVAPPQLFRYNRFVSATVSAQLAKGYTLGQGLDEMDRIKQEILPENFSNSLSGPSQDYAESSGGLWGIFGLALLLVFMVMAAQYESLRDPLVIILTVPLALAGALLSLWYFQQTLNLFSKIGIIMLIGLVTKNGILIVEFATQRKAVLLNRRAAVMEAAAERFRPIIMTSLCTALGFLPIALALGAGAESRVGMGVAVVGGVIFATGLTLYVIPALYTYLSAPPSARNLPKEEIIMLPSQPTTEPELARV